MAELNTKAGRPNSIGSSGLRPNFGGHSSPGPSRSLPSLCSGALRSALGRRCRKLSTRVDMTPMVDLGFLLITFFVFTTTMSRPKELEVRKPADGDPTKTGANATLTLVALGGNKVFYYNGEFSEALHNGSFGTAGYGRNGGIGDIIRDKQTAMDRYYKGGRKQMMLLIKPSPESSYGNVVSLLDETQINDVKRYALVELTPEEKSGISSKNL